MDNSFLFPHILTGGERQPVRSYRWPPGTNPTSPAGRIVLQKPTGGKGGARQEELLVTQQDRRDNQQEQDPQKARAQQDVETAFPSSL
jgi:hypothetical protein